MMYKDISKQLMCLVSSRSISIFY